MGELMIEIRYYREDDDYSTDVEAYHDGKNIELTLASDEQFCKFLCYLGKRFSEIVVELNAEK